MTTNVDSKEEILEMIAREGYGMDYAQEIWDAWIEYHGESYPPCTWMELLDSIYGKFDNPKDFAQDYVDLNGQTIDPLLFDYVDWDRYAEDVLNMSGMYMSDNGWVLIC